MKIETIKVGDYRTNCYLVYDKNKEAFLVDPGDEAETILSKISELKLNLKFILLTHGHFDHVLAVDEIKSVYPSIDVFMNEKDVFLLDDIFEQGVFVKKYLHEFKSKIVAVNDGDVINHGDLRIRVISTPGHTPGGVCFLVEDFLFTGDTLFYHTVGRTDLPFSSVTDLSASLQKLLKLDKKLLVYPGHGRESTISEELKNNKYFN